MRLLRSRARTALALVPAVLLLAACGDTPKIPQAPSQSPFQASSVTFKQTGDASATVVQSSVKFSTDASGALVVRGQVHSTASGETTIVIRVSLIDANGNVVGDATGADVGVPGGATVPFQLNGPKPNGTIVSATFEVTAKPPAT